MLVNYSYTVKEVMLMGNGKHSDSSGPCFLKRVIWTEVKPLSALLLSLSVGNTYTDETTQVETAISHTNECVILRG